MIPAQAYKSLGLISIAITWIGLIYLIRKWPGNKSMSFSSHATKAKKATTFYGLLFSITLPIFYIFISKWFAPTLSLPNSFIIITFIGCLGQLIAVWVPGMNRRKQLIHNIAAYTMHTLLLVLVLMILINGKISSIARTVAVAAEIYMVIVWLSFAFVKSAKKHTLRLQASYVAMFHITILTASYIR